MTRPTENFLRGFLFDERFPSMRAGGSGSVDQPGSATASKRAVELTDGFDSHPDKAHLGSFGSGTWATTTTIAQGEVSLVIEPAAVAWAPRPCLRRRRGFRLLAAMCACAMPER